VEENPANASFVIFPDAFSLSSSSMISTGFMGIK
jgi:hypothetical protein